MDINKLKLYNKYYDVNEPNIELIYIGIDNEDDYWYLYKYEDRNSSFSLLKVYCFDPNKITKDLNLETFIDFYGDKYIKGYELKYRSKEYIETYFKPILKDKLNNILNR